MALVAVGASGRRGKDGPGGGDGGDDEAKSKASSSSGERDPPFPTSKNCTPNFSGAGKKVGSWRDWKKNLFSYMPCGWGIGELGGVTCSKFSGRWWSFCATD